MRRYFLSCVLLFLWSSLLLAQKGYVAPKIPEKTNKELEQAILQAEAGKAEDAIQTIEGIIARYPTWTYPRQELGRIYYENGKKQEAVKALQASLLIDTASQLQQLYALGKIYEETSEFEKAIACYRGLMFRSDTTATLFQKAKENKRLLENKKALMVETYAIHPVPFPPEINTEAHEALGRWSLDGEELIFTRMVDGQEDLFFAHPAATPDHWVIEPFPFNTPQNEGAHAISPDGKYLVFTSCNRPDGNGSCDLYISVLKQGKWTKPVNMGPGFNSISWDGQPCFGLDGSSLFFSSSRIGGFGGKDIWYMNQLSPDSWSRPMNAGQYINTPDNEESPFLHFDGQALYFMRDGKEGLGGYDLYMSRKGPDGNWQKAVNLGAPINTGSNEGALSLHPDGYHAIITQETPDRQNDLFQITLPEKFRAYPQQALFVRIRDKTTGKPVSAALELFQLNAEHAIRLTQWSDINGNLTTSIQRNVDYGAIASSPDYVMCSVQLPADSASSRSITLDMIPLTRAVNEPIILENISFNSGSAELLPESEPELNKLLYTLKAHQTMKIEIRGHTDNIGDESANKRLSTDRARAVYDWLVKRGIASTRILFAGFGEAQPIADNMTIEGRRKNRRTEFIITAQ